MEDGDNVEYISDDAFVAPDIPLEDWESYKNRIAVVEEKRRATMAMRKMTLDNMSCMVSGYDTRSSEPSDQELFDKVQLIYESCQEETLSIRKIMNRLEVAYPGVDMKKRRDLILSFF